MSYREGVDPVSGNELTFEEVIAYYKDRIGEFVPGTVISHKTPPYVETYWEDVPAYAEDISKYVTVLRCIETHRVVGCKMYGVRKVE